MNLLKATQKTPRIKPNGRCKGYWTDTPDGRDFDCEYGTTLSCDECKYGHGRRDPEAKRNQWE